MMPEPMKIVSIVGIIFFALLFLLCFVKAVAPRWCWRTFESWKAKEEPSKAYFIAARIVGIAGMVIVAAVALAPTIMYLLQ